MMEASKPGVLEVSSLFLRAYTQEVGSPLGGGAIPGASAKIPV